MGCFFGCFRFGHDGSTSDRHHLPSDHASRPPGASTTAEHVASRNRSPLSSLFVSEEQTSLQSKGAEKLGCTTPVLDLDVNELRDQAKFLKACGTLPETPIEIRQLSNKYRDLSPQKGELEPLKFDSWLPDNSIEKKTLVIQPDNSPALTKDCPEWVNGPGSSHDTPSSCMTYEENSDSVTISSASPAIVPPSRQRHVHFECKPDVSKSSSEVASPNSKPSPSPTPLKLSDEMQTPGTVFSTYVDNLPNGKNPRIRSQYVCAVLNPIENASQLKKVTDEEKSASMQDSNSKLSLSDTGESFEFSNEVNFAPKMGLTENNNVNVEESLSSWLKPRFGGNNHRGKPQGDRPILRMVVAHWNENEASQVSPRWWDGNGIPN